MANNSKATNQAKTQPAAQGAPAPEAVVTAPQPTAISNAVAEVLTEADFHKQYYLGIDTAQISTTLVDQKIVGAVGNKNPNLPSEVSVTLAANKKRSNMYFHYITKSAQGKFTLNTLFPMLYSDFAKRPTANNPYDNVSVYIAIAAHNGEYERNVGTPERPQMALTYANGNLANIGRMYTSKRITGATITANISQALIPASVNNWSNAYHTQIGGKDYAVGYVINRNTLNTWNKIRKIQANVDDEYGTEAEKNAAIEAVWDAYQSNRQDWVNRNYLTSSNVLYAIENGIKNTTAAELGYSNAAPELNAASLYGTDSGKLSFIPDTNRAHATAILTDAVTDETGNFHYGIYPQNIQNKNDLQTLTDEDEIRRTLEVCTRELQVSDGAGNNVTISARMKDNAFGTRTGGERNINKRSRAFCDVPVGSQIAIVGSKLVPRYSKEGTQAIRFELHDINYKVMNSAASNLVVGDLTSEQIDFDPQNAEHMAMVEQELDEFDLDAPTAKAPAKSKSSEKAVTTSTAQEDEDM